MWFRLCSVMYQMYIPFPPMYVDLVWPCTQSPLIHTFKPCTYIILRVVVVFSWGGGGEGGLALVWSACLIYRLIALATYRTLVLELKAGSFHMNFGFQLFPRIIVLLHPSIWQCASQYLYHSPHLCWWCSCTCHYENFLGVTEQIPFSHLNMTIMTNNSAARWWVIPGGDNHSHRGSQGIWPTH